MTFKLLEEPIVKPPRYLESRNFQKINDDLVQSLYDYNKEEFERILDLDENWGQIDHTFLGFVDTYEALSKLIELDRHVIDFGCFCAPQAFYFRHHKSYIGVDAGSISPGNRFTFSNTKHYQSSIQDWIKQYGEEFRNLDTFAICNYVPDTEAQRMVRETFPHVYVYYP